MNDKQKLARAFRILRNKGYFAKVTFIPCCGSCGHSELADKGFEKYVFFNKQSSDYSMPHGILEHEMYLGWWTPDEDASEIVEVLKASGIDASWTDSTQNVRCAPSE